MQRVSCDEGSGPRSQQLQRIAASQIRLHFGFVFAHGESWPESDCSRAGIVAGEHLRVTVSGHTEAMATGRALWRKSCQHDELTALTQRRADELAASSWLASQGEVGGQLHL